MEISYDDESWSDTYYLIQTSAISPYQFWLLAFFNDQRAEKIYSSTSIDKGYTWSLTKDESSIIRRLLYIPSKCSPVDK